MISFASATSTQQGLQVRFVGGSGEARGARFVVPWWWLRDHGEDAQSRDPDTCQRLVDTLKIDPAIAPYGMGVAPDQQSVGIRWRDGSATMHTAAGLSDAYDSRRLLGPSLRAKLQRPPGDEDVVLWSTPANEATRVFFYPDLLRGGDNTADWLRHIRRWGVAVVDGVPPGRAPVRELAALLGYVRETVFGGVWELDATVTDHADSAYSTTELAPHTDGSYSHDAPGLQLFSCQQREGEGGHSTLVDGFAAAARLMDTHPQFADILSRVSVVGQYVEPGVHLTADRPPLRFDARGRLRQVTYNNYDRAPFLVHPAEDAARVRDAMATFGRMVTDPSARIELGWKPAQLMVIDNWRLLHGRTTYSGRRRFFGCYTNYEDFESRLRVL